MIVALVAAFAWSASRPVFPRLSLREPSLSLPDPAELMNPGAGGRPVLLVVIENTPQARPQAGLADACLVIAAPTEARITRFLAAYCREAPAVIGPVRSARPYMLELAADLGAILVHAGQSSEAMGMIASRRQAVLNQFWTPGPFWREASRPMPHNLYTSYARLLAAARQKPFPSPRPLPVTFAYESPPGWAEARRAAGAALDYGPLYGVRYEYRPARGRYARFQDGRPHTDADGAPVEPRSVVVLLVRWEGYLVRGEPASRLVLTGGGRMIVLTGGRVLEGAWQRPPGGPLALALADGGPPVLPPGPVWIELLPHDSPLLIEAGNGSAR